MKTDDEGCLWKHESWDVWHALVFSSESAANERIRD